MKLIVVGCGRVGSALAYQLSKKGHQVTVIDQDSTSFDNLPEDFQGRTIHGDVLARNVLHRAEIEYTDGLAAVTSLDSLNALVAYIAKTEYRIAKVVARNYDPRQRPLQEAFGIPVASSASTGTQHIEEMLLDKPLRAFSIDGNTNLVIYQLEVPDSWHGHPSEELLPADRIKLIAWMRSGKPVPVSSTQPLQGGDFIFLTADPEMISALERRLNSQKEQFV